MSGDPLVEGLDAEYPPERFYPPQDHGERVEWRVIWFPPDRPYALKTGSEEVVRRAAEQHAGEAPIVESCTVTRTLWRAS